MKLIYQINQCNKNNRDYHSGWRIDINPSPPAPSTDVWLTHWVLTLGKHVPCLSEDNPVVLRAMQPGEVAGRMIDCNINFCLIIGLQRNEKKKKKQDTNYSVALFFHFPPPDPRRRGGSLCSLTLVEILCYRNERKKLFIKVRPLREVSLQKTSLLREMEAARKNKKSPMIGKDAMVCVSQVKDITHSLAVPWQAGDAS